MTCFHVELLPADPILSLPQLFQADTHPQKVNLGVGSYRDAEGKTLVLTSVRAAEQAILEENLAKEYLPIEGNPEFLQSCQDLVFGSELATRIRDRLVGFQAMGGTSAIRVGAEFLKQGISPCMYISQPTWPNHRLIMQRTGLAIQEYPYYDYSKHQVDFDLLCSSLKEAPVGSAVLLQANCHNPTGIDLTQEQWKELSSLMKQLQLLPFFDLAYQGFGKGVEEDAWPVRYFAEEGHEGFVAVSFSKNMGLYGERVGFGCVITADAETAKRVNSHIKQIIRTSYSNPGLHGGRIVSRILRNSDLRTEWIEELTEMRLRIHEMRRALHARLLVDGMQMDIDFMLRQNGMFSLLGLDGNQVKRLRAEFGVYTLENSRINVAGLTSLNLDYVSQAIVHVTQL